MLFRSNQEVGCLFIGERRSEGLLLIDAYFDSSNDNSVDPLFLNGVPREFIARAKDSRAELLTGHMHARKYGERIEPFDPYWTVHAPDGVEPGTILSGTFYASSKGGDTHGIKGWGDYFQMVHSLAVSKTLLIHPAYGSEGKSMQSNLVTVTAYKLDLEAPFGVREVFLAHI